MDRYTVRLSSRIEEQLGKFEEKLRERIIRKLAPLRDDPRPADCKKLRGNDNAYRIRVGDYRIIYEVRDSELVVLVLRAAHRGEVYRGA